MACFQISIVLTFAPGMKKRKNVHKVYTSLSNINICWIHEQLAKLIHQRGPQLIHTAILLDVLWTIEAHQQV